jgi:hypothetical protein
LSSIIRLERSEEDILAASFAISGLFVCCELIERVEQETIFRKVPNRIKTLTRPANPAQKTKVNFIFNGMPIYRHLPLMQEFGGARAWVKFLKIFDMSAISKCSFRRKTVLSIIYLTTELSSFPLS